MATALANGPTIKWVGSANGCPARILKVAEGTSETFQKGDLVLYDRSENGLVIAPNTSGQFDVAQVFGIAQQDASGTAGTAIDVLIPRTTDYFSAGLASATDTFVAPDQDDRGALYELIQMDSANNSGVAVLEENTTPMVTVLEVHRQDITARGGDPADATTPTMSAGDRVVFSFIASALDAAGFIA